MYHVPTYILYISLQNTLYLIHIVVACCRIYLRDIGILCDYIYTLDILKDKIYIIYFIPNKSEVILLFFCEFISLSILCNILCWLLGIILYGK